MLNALSRRHFPCIVAALSHPTLAAALVSSSLLAGCQIPGPRIASENPTEAVAALLVGSFSSAEQAKADKDFRQIDLHMVRIWPTRNDGPWLYIEQAVASEPLKPYRQRIYQLAMSDNPDAVPGTVESRVFELPGDPLAFAGAWAEPSRFDSITIEQLVPREGCTVYLVPNTDGSWSGGTDGNGCSSAMRGASYATSEVTATMGELRTWDRGFDKDGKQVWGAEKGAYIFRRDEPKKEAPKVTAPTSIGKPIGIR
jgi:CpeT protein